jgi:hypothetical protein
VLRRTPHAVDGVKVEELVALADESLPDERRADVEARVAASPTATELLRAQRRAVEAVRAFAVAAPPGLRPPEPAMPARRLRVARPLLGAACAAAAAVTAVSLSPGPPDSAFARMAAVSARPASEVPGPASGGPGVLRRSFAGVTFPDWSRSHDWQAVGARHDRVNGRATDTVFYRHSHHQIAYTVLSGHALGLPEDGRRVEAGGVTVQVFHDGPRTVAVFERGGRTCVLAGVVHREETLVMLAAWKGDGALTF